MPSSDSDDSLKAVVAPPSAFVGKKTPQTMDQDELHKLEDQCIQEQPPNCAAACPVHVDVRAMMAEAARGNFADAAKILKKTIPFPGIISRICDQPCRSLCKRKEAGDPLSVAAIEKACLDYADETPERIVALPKKDKRVAVVGGGLSGLTAALDLARKGYAVVVFEKEPNLGGGLRRFPEEKLPREVIARDLLVLERLGVEIRLGAAVGKDVSFDSICGEFDAVYVAAGEAPESFGFAIDVAGRGAVDPTTLASGREKVFAGGSLRRAENERSPIHSISDGRIAAVSIDRFLQKVSLTASRAGEGPVRTRLFTGMEGVEPAAVTPMSEPKKGYTREEAVGEAARCLQCECLECVKVCEFLSSFRAYPRKYVRQVYNNLSIVMGHRHANKLINSCSLCGLCQEVCPEDLHMGLVCKKAREILVNRGKMPPSAHDFPLKDMAFSNGEKCAFARRQPGMDRSRSLFFPGCRLAASAPEHVKSVYNLLREKLSGGVGFMARCCGAPADWSGRAELFRSTLEEFRTLWREMGDPRLILACSTCYEVFKTHCPDVPIASLWEVLDNLGLPESANIGKSEVLAVHDACTTRHESAVQESVRNILRRLGFTIEELPLSRNRTECCGFGGLMFFANPDLTKRAIRRRIAESPRDYLTYCAMCRDYLASSGKRAIHLLDLIFKTPPDEAALRKGPTYSESRANRIRLKNSMLKELWGETVDRVQGYAAVRLKISDAVQQLMEDRLILVEDLQLTIDAAERSGFKLLNRETGRFTAHYKSADVTYWVEYSPSGNEFVVHNAYSHRMGIAEDAKP